MIVWLIPSMIVGRAKGSCTPSSSWRGVVPAETAASMVVVGSWRMPRLVRRMAGGRA